jgi:rhamnosyltransferase
MSQKECETHLLIRDDGSNPETVQILKRLIDKNNDYIECIFGENIGWKKSFMTLLSCAPAGYDYYGFSDQDDIWFEDKLYSCIELMEEDNDNCIKLAHCNALSVDSNLNLREEQENRAVCPPSFSAALTTEYFQGCGMVWNNSAMNLIKEYEPQNRHLAHDYWVGLLCYCFGKVYFCEDAKFYHIRYGNNCSSDGNIKAGRINRLKNFLNGKVVYMNPAEDMLNGYYKRLHDFELSLLQDIVTYKHDRKAKRRLLLSKNFSRPSFFSTCLLKIAILLNKY